MFTENQNNGVNARFSIPARGTTRMMRGWRWRDAAADTPVRWRCVHPTIVRTVLRTTAYAAAGWRSSASFQEHSFSLHLHLHFRSVPTGARSADLPSLIVTGASPLRGRLDDGASVRRPDPHRLAIPPRRSHRRRTSGAGRRALCQARASAQTAALECSAPCAGPPSAALQSRK